MNTLKTTLATTAFLLSGSVMAETINSDLLSFASAGQRVMNQNTAKVEDLSKQYNLNVDTMGCHLDSIVAVHEALRTQNTTETDVVGIVSDHKDCLTTQTKARTFDNM